MVTDSFAPISGTNAAKIQINVDFILIDKYTLNSASTCVAEMTMQNLQTPYEDSSSLHGRMKSGLISPISDILTEKLTAGMVSLLLFVGWSWSYNMCIT